MTYAHPELVLVGAAQNLVLGESHPINGCSGLDALPDQQGVLYTEHEDW
jgi:hypothetical protein